MKTLLTLMTCLLLVGPVSAQDPYAIQTYMKQDTFFAGTLPIDTLFIDVPLKGMNPLGFFDFVYQIDTIAARAAGSGIRPQIILGYQRLLTNQTATNMFKNNATHLTILGFGDAGATGTNIIDSVLAPYGQLNDTTFTPPISEILRAFITIGDTADQGGYLGIPDTIIVTGAIQVQ